MKRFTYLLLAATLFVPAVGCKQQTATTAPQAVAPGYINAQDQVMGQTLKGVHAFIDNIRAQISTGYVPGPTEKTALNALIATTNAADATYLAFHGGTATQAAAQAAINQAYSQQQSLATSIQGGK